MVVVVMSDRGVRESDAEDVAGQILQCLFAITHTFDINHPVSIPDFVRDRFKNCWVGFFQTGFEPLPVDTGKCMGRYEETVFWPTPNAGLIEAPAGDEVVDVRVIDHGPRPGVKHSGDARDGAEPFWILAQIRQ